jgi:hypothetical protein
LRRERDVHAALAFRAAADPEERFLAGAETLGGPRRRPQNRDDQSFELSGDPDGEINRPRL